MAEQVRSLHHKAFVVIGCKFWFPVKEKASEI